MRNLERRLLVTAVLATGCVDPEARYQSFVERSQVSTPDAAPGDAATCAVEPGSVQGQYLLALSVNVAPTKPIVALVDLDTPAFSGGTGLRLDAQPLRFTDRKTPVGERLVLGPFSVAADGTYGADVPGLDITGEANPVTPGADISASAVLTGNLCGDGRFFCGTLKGTATKPLALPLAGSTFTLTRVETPDEWSTQPAVDCAGTQADPL